MGKPERVIELLVMIVLIAMAIQCIAQDWPISTFLVKPRGAVAQPASSQMLGRIRIRGGRT